MVVTIEHIRSLGAPLRPYLFSLVIDPRGSAGASGYRFSLLCTSVTFPGKSIETAEVNLSSFTVRYAGRETYDGSFNVTFVELTTSEVFSRLQSWAKLCFDTMTGIQALPEVYKSDASLFLLNDSRMPVARFKIVGLWPRELPQLDFDSAASDTVTYQATFSYDYWIDM